MSNFVFGAGLSNVSAISRSQDKLDIFTVGLDGHIYTAAWQSGDNQWRGWWQIKGLDAAPCSSVCAVSRSTDMLDIFAVGLDGRIYTAAWQPGDTTWHGWRAIGSLKTTLHGSISAVSRSKDKLDIFVSGLDSHVYTAAWQPGDNQWRGWWRIGNIKVPPGSPVSSVSRSKDKLDIFVTGSDSRVYTAAWQSGDTKWRGWWMVGDLNVLPRTQVAAVVRSTDMLDIFTTDKNGKIHTAAWQKGDTNWRGWWPVGNFTTNKRATVTAISRSVDKMDIFTIGNDGRIYTAAWERGFTGWHGWWTINDLITDLNTTVGVISRNTDKLDIFASGTDGKVYTAAWEKGDTKWRGWWSIPDIITGMTDPKVNNWEKVGVAFKSENTSHSEEAQGMTTDGESWFLVSNNTKSIRKYGGGARLLAEITVPEGKQGGHIGAAGCFEGWLYVPVQHPYGIFKTTTNFSSKIFRSAEKGSGRFPWCDVNPLNGRLYTSEFDHWNNSNGILFAHDIDTIERRPEDDIYLGNTPIHFDRIQGGVFTRHGRVILCRSDPNGIFCFSAITGHCFGGKYLGDFGSSYSEVESVTVRAWQFDGITANVHVLELDNDGTSKDDCYLHSFHVPYPDQL